MSFKVWAFVLVAPLAGCSTTSTTSTTSTRNTETTPETVVAIDPTVQAE